MTIRLPMVVMIVVIVITRDGVEAVYNNQLCLSTFPILAPPCKSGGIQDFY